jgi:c-di-GMP-binding flagellar brake protein YcgR
MVEYAIQRRFPRFPIKLPVLYKMLEPTPGKPGVGWTRDLSEGGACLELADRLEASSVLRLLLRSDRRGLELDAVVIWSGPPGSQGGGVLHGVSFIEADPAHQQALREVLVDHRVQHREAGVRVPLEIPVRCRAKGAAGLPVEGRTGDVSRGGLLLRLPLVIPPPAVVEVVLPTARGPIQAEGEIVWVESLAARKPGEMVRHGLRFTELTWPNQLTLGLLLAAEP